MTNHIEPNHIQGTQRPSPPAHRGRIEIVPWEPSAERAVVLMRTMIWTLVTTFVTAVALALAPVTPGLRWGLVAVAVLIGLTPLAWHRLTTRRAHRLPTWDLTPKLAGQVAQAAEQADQLRRMAARPTVQSPIT